MPYSTRVAGLALGAFLLLVPTPASVARAQAPLIDGLGGTVDYGEDCLGMNDDGSSNVIDLRPYFPAGLRFFDRTHTSLYVNTNGSVSFSGPVPAFTATAFPVADQPMIAPYWADVDIRTFDRVTGIMRRCNGPADGDRTLGPACHFPTENGVWWHVEPGRVVVTWDRVAYFKCRSDLDQRMSFQLVISEVESDECGALGDFDVEFRYNRCEWTTGDASRGEDGSLPSGGFGGTPAQAGFDAGNLADFVMIPGSRTGDIHTILCTDSNVEEAGVWRFQIRSGEIICPGAGAPCDTGMPGVCADGRMQCVADRLECRQLVAPSPEVCDALDNDCDGTVDQGDLCESFEACIEGACVGTCFEGGCFDGFVCNDDGRCVEEACVGVSCGEGQRCEAGTCTSPCDGVSCPHGTDCIAGACLDLCAEATCDDCSVCAEGGACLTRCQLEPCPDGLACTATGRCVEPGCVDVFCEAGTHCEGGECVDSCAGATCPRGQICSEGRCVDGDPPPAPDGGVPPAVDGGGAPLVDGGPPETDGGVGLDGGSEPPEEGGCGCRAPGLGGSQPLSVPALLVMLFVATARRRRRRS